MPEGILLVDPLTGRIVDANPAMVALLGYPHAELVGRELVQCNFRDIASRQAGEAAQHAADLKVALHTADLETIVSRRTAELQAANSQLQTFVYSIAHDLRAPLRAMQGFSQLLVQDHAASLNEQGQEYANFISAGAQTMDQLLADLLAFSHLSQQEIKLAPVSLEAVIAGALSGCAAEISARGAQIEVATPLPTVMAHETVLRQVLVNLIGNAVKFVAAGKVPQVHLHAEEAPGGAVRLWVDDNGIGISAEFHDRIFQVFQRLHATEYAGTGIGLAIVHKGMERMAGRSGVLSRPGQGSRFWIELPAGPSLTL